MAYKQCQQHTRTQVRQVCIVQALVKGGINDLLLGCKEFVLFHQKSGGRFVLLSRKTGDLIVSWQLWETSSLLNLIFLLPRFKIILQKI